MMNQIEKKARNHSFRLFGGVVLAVVILPSLAFAGGGEGYVPSIADTLKYWVNFLIFMGVMVFILRKPFGAFWVSRAETIHAAVNAGQEAARLAGERLESAKARIANLAEEIAALQARIATESEDESKRLLTEARQRAEAIQARAREAVQAERMNLEVRIREEIANQIVERAEQLARERLDAATDRRLRDATLSGVSGLIQ
jgi:F-type H+-transporting ATPase subunit b